MKRTIYLPDHLAEQIDVYLDEHPNETLSSLVQGALELKLAPKDLSQLLSLTGIVQHPTHPAADQAEDRLINTHPA
jgi:metal-responsive CopG/Arc/MetJ family transcriptional regulator